MFGLAPPRLENGMSMRIQGLVSITLIVLAKFAGPVFGDPPKERGKADPVVLSMSGVFFSNVAFSPDGKSIAVAAYEGKPGDVKAAIKIWDATTGKERLRISEALPVGSQLVTVIAFGPDGKLLASGSERGHINVWEATSGKSVFTGRHGDGHPVSSLVFSPDGKRLASTSKRPTSDPEGSLKLWRLAD
jgi:WD40 repeat protein